MKLAKRIAAMLLTIVAIAAITNNKYKKTAYTIKLAKKATDILGACFKENTYTTIAAIKIAKSAAQAVTKGMIDTRYSNIAELCLTFRSHGASCRL